MWEPVFFVFECSLAVFILKFLILDSHFGVLFNDEASKQVSERLVIPKEKAPRCRSCFFFLKSRLGVPVFSFFTLLLDAISGEKTKKTKKNTGAPKRDFKRKTSGPGGANSKRGAPRREFKRKTTPAHRHECNNNKHWDPQE